MSARRVLCPLALVAIAAALAGCGATGGERGTATLWITRDRGASVLLDERVAAGQTLLRALRSKADVDTRYGGRFVQAIDGLESNSSRQHDWFWFVNGLSGDTSAVEYRLRDGDVAWWDYRDWSGDAMTVDVVAGAFPEPFVHGFAGATRPVSLRYASGRQADAKRVARRIDADDVAPAGTPVPDGNHLFVLGATGGPPTLTARLGTPGSGPKAAVRFTYTGAVGPLLGGSLVRRFGP